MWFELIVDILLNKCFSNLGDRFLTICASLCCDGPLSQMRFHITFIYWVHPKSKESVCFFLCNSCTFWKVKTAWNVLHMPSGWELLLPVTWFDFFTQLFSIKSFHYSIGFYGGIVCDVHCSMNFCRLVLTKHGLSNTSCKYTHYIVSCLYELEVTIF